MKHSSLLQILKQQKSEEFLKQQKEQIFLDCDENVIKAKCSSLSYWYVTDDKGKTVL
jgi:hypothetical protein